MTLKCKLREIPKSSFSANALSPKKFGRYLKSVFPSVPGYGESRWVVGCYVDFDYHAAMKRMSEEEMISELVEYLNRVPPREKFQRKPTSSLYGNLELFSYKLKDNNGKPFIEMLLITDDPKNDNFWGEGAVHVGSKRPRRRHAKSH
tara:strand:- start:1300 stop:1740 length:441 start_codon:yes stop_codon:yes gene_type:complete